MSSFCLVCEDYGIKSHLKPDFVAMQALFVKTPCQDSLAQTELPLTSFQQPKEDR